MVLTKRFKQFRQPDNVDSRKNELKALKETNDRLLEILLQLANNEQKIMSNKQTPTESGRTSNGSNNSIRPKQPSTLIGDRINCSGLEFLTQTALKYSTNECFVFNRVLESI